MYPAYVMVCTACYSIGKSPFSEESLSSWGRIFLPEVEFKELCIMPILVIKTSANPIVSLSFGQNNYPIRTLENG